MRVEEYEPGTPSWADVSSPDIAASARFYADLFGWHADDQGAEAGHYTMFLRDGRSVAGCGPSMLSDTPPVWMTYFAVADAERSAQAVHVHGGTVLAGPLDVFDSGRMVVAADPSGGVFAMWQPGEHLGAEVVNEPGSMCWNELGARDPEAVLGFYSALFGWTVQVQGGDDAPFTYREIHLGERLVAGCIEMDDSWPADIPTHWMVYFAVDDCDATCARVRDLGGAVNVEPFDLPVGRTAVVSDPMGAHFSVIALADSPT